MAKKTKYGLLALLSLAREVEGNPVLIADLAAREDMPRKFLETILLELKRAGFLGSRKGKGGGYFLARRPDQVTLGEVLRVLEGPLAPVPCVSRSAHQRCEDCRDEDTCGIRLVMQDVRDAVARILDHTTLAAVNARSDQAARQARNIIDFTI